MKQKAVIGGVILGWGFLLTLVLWGHWTALFLFWSVPLILGSYLGFHFLLEEGNFDVALPTQGQSSPGQSPTPSAGDFVPTVAPPPPSKSENPAEPVKSGTSGSRPISPPSAPPPKSTSPVSGSKPPAPQRAVSSLASPAVTAPTPTIPSPGQSISGPFPAMTQSLPDGARLEQFVKTCAQMPTQAIQPEAFEAKLLALACDLFEATEAQFYALDPKAPEFMNLTASFPPNSSTNRRDHFTWKNSALETVILEGEQFFPTEPRKRIFANLPPINTLACTPLLNGDKCFGLFSIEKTARPFSVSKPNPGTFFLAGQMFGFMIAAVHEIKECNDDIRDLKAQVNTLSAYKRRLESTTQYLDNEVDRQYFEKIDLEKEKSHLFDSFQKFLSPIIIERIMSDPNALKLGGVKQPVTIFFSDIRGFTKMSETMDPTDVVKFLNEYFSQMTAIVYKYEGTLDKFVGDEIMALFGAPLQVPPKEAALRAVLCALEMKQKMSTMRAEWQAKGFPLFDIGIGLNTGEVTVGFIGSEQVLSYTAIGDTVNLASRLCAAAAPNQIILSADTANYIGSEFVSMQQLAPIQVKGKQAPIQIFEAGGLLNLPPFASPEGLPAVIQ
jgi:class 3 adenylate cyclase